MVSKRRKWKHIEQTLRDGGTETAYVGTHGWVELSAERDWFFVRCGDYEHELRFDLSHSCSSIYGAKHEFNRCLRVLAIELATKALA